MAASSATTRPARSTGILNSPQNVEALEAYRELYTFTPPNWAQAFFAENNQAFTEGLVAMSMNYFAFFPALANEATNPHAANTGYFANPPGPNGDQHAALGGQGISIVSYCQNQEESKKFLEWFIQDDVQKRWAELGGYTCHAAVLESEEFRNATPYNRGLLPDSMFDREGLLGRAGLRRHAVPDERPRSHPYVTTRRGHRQGSARRARRGLGSDARPTASS